MEKIGYKCFNKDMTNRYGLVFNEGCFYKSDKEPKFGNDGHGFHFCKNLEDTFRYFPAIEDSDSICVCMVRGFGNIKTYDDDYYGYYDMYVADNIEILKKLSREEIFEYVLKCYKDRVIRFIKTYKLNDYEIEVLMKKYSNDNSINNVIEYFQFGNTEVYSKKTK